LKILGKAIALALMGSGKTGEKILLNRVETK
jgi:hypothetical protein